MSVTHLYILKSLKNGRLYVGVTSCLEERLEKHNTGKVVPTKKDCPYKLIYSEVFDDLVSARRRENFFKTGDGRRVVKRLISEWSAKNHGGLPKSAIPVVAAQSAAKT